MIPGYFDRFGVQLFLWTFFTLCMGLGATLVQEAKELERCRARILLAPQPAASEPVRTFLEKTT